MLTRTESRLNQLMESREVDLHSRMYVLIVLKHESIYKSMIQWIKKNPSARQSEILKQTDVLRPDQNFVPRKTHNIAKVAMF